MTGPADALVVAASSSVAHCSRVLSHPHRQELHQKHQYRRQPTASSSNLGQDSRTWTTVINPGHDHRYQDHRYQHPYSHHRYQHPYSHHRYQHPCAHDKRHASSKRHIGSDRRHQYRRRPKASNCFLPGAGATSPNAGSIPPPPRGPASPNAPPIKRAPAAEGFPSAPLS